MRVNGILLLFSFWDVCSADCRSICWAWWWPAWTQGVNNRWNRWSENQSINRWQSMPINRLISIINEQSMLEFYVIINFIDYQFLSIINTNRSVNLHRLLSIGCHFLCVLSSVKISKTRSLYASNNDENCDKIFSQRWLIHRGEHGYMIL